MAHFSMKGITNIFCLIACITFQACGQESSSKIDKSNVENETQATLNPNGNNLESRILPPSGFSRIKVEPGSFSSYLRNLPLLPNGSIVKLYNGKEKGNNWVYCAVINLPIGDKDLHQCADAIIRLRAEYFYSQGQYDKIHFDLTNGFRVDYSEWIKGKRVVVNGNQTYWKQTTALSNTYKDFWSYLEFVFTYAGTLSLSKELKTITIDQLEIGDIFIKCGSPGHAALVVDIAVDSTTRKKIFLLAQSYMPAQEIQILADPYNKLIDPWYSTDFGQHLGTPEWTFSNEEIKRFKNAP